MDAFILNLLNSPEFQNLVTMFLVPLAVNSISDRLKALKAALKDKTHEEQLLDCLEKAFFETERTLGWKHDTEAIYETFMGSLMSFSGSFNKDSLAHIFRDAVGADVAEKEIALWIYNVKKQISLDEHAKLREFLYVSHVFDDSKEKSSTDLGYLLTYTTPVWDNKDVICRDDIIEELFAKFSKGMRRIQVAGMGGLGKSEILVKFFYQLNLPNPPVQFDYIGFIRFNDDLESNLRLQIPFLTEYAKNHGEAEAKRFLQQLCATNRVLFCIDDNRDKKDILKKNDPSFAFLKTLNASILFASRTEYPEFEQQNLPLLPTDACIEVFQRMYGQEIHNQKDLAILTNIIGDLSGNNTLIVNRLGNMARENNFTIDKLQNNLQDKNFHIKIGCIDEEELQQQISKLYPLSELTNQGERSIVEAFSIFPVNPLAVGLCVEWLHEDAGINVDECSRTLTRLSKQTWLEKRIDASNGEVFFSMHQCVKSAVTDQGALAYASHRILYDKCVMAIDMNLNAFNYAKSTPLIPFAISLFSQIPDLAVLQAKLATTLASYYNFLGNYSASLEWSFEVLTRYKMIYGEDHQRTASILNNIATMYYYQSDYKSAIEWHMNAIRIREKLLGKEHIDTANSYNNIGAAYERLGEYDIALTYHIKALKIRIKAMGKQSLLAATSYHNIGNIYDAKRDYESALFWHIKSLTIRESLLDLTHPDLAGSYNNIGNDYLKKGDFSEALSYFNKSLEIYLRVFGENHPYTAMVLTNIAGAQHSLGNLGEAYELYLKALKIREDTIGCLHSDSATSYNNIAAILHDQGKYDEALVLYEKALNINLKIVGELHSDIAFACTNIGCIYDETRDHLSALKWHNRALNILESVFGLHNQNTAICYNNIGRCYFFQNDYEIALKMYNNALEILQNSLGNEHPDTAKIVNNIAAVFENQHKFDLALIWYKRALLVFEKKFSPSNPLILDTKSKIDILEERLGI